MEAKPSHNVIKRTVVIKFSTDTEPTMHAII